MVSAVLPLYLVFYQGLSPLQFGMVDGLYQGVTALIRIAGGVIADRYRIELSGGITLTTSGPATSFLWSQSGGSFSAHVVGLNACGSG